MKKLLTFLTVVLSMVWANAQTYQFYYNGANEVFDPAGFFTKSEKFNKNTKYTGTVILANGTSHECTNGLKMESATELSFATDRGCSVIIVQSTKTNGTNTIKFDGQELTGGIDDPEGWATARVFTVENVQAGDHNVTRGNAEAGLLYVCVTLDELKGEQLSTPEISFDNITGEVTISPVANASKVVYTTDGSMPTEESTEYTGPFTVEDGSVVKAVAIGNGEAYSNSTAAEVTVLLVGQTVDAPTFFQFNGTFALATTTNLGKCEYSLDGGTTWNAYSIPVTLFENKTVNARATRENWTTSEIVEFEITALPALEGINTKTVYLGAGAFDIVAATADKGGVLKGIAGSEADGYSIEIMVANKAWAKDSKKITLAEGVERTSFYGSNGAQNTIYLPEGVKAYRATFYSYMPTLGRISGWNEVNGDKDTHYQDIPLLSQDPANPDVRVFDFGTEGVVDSFTFAQTGERPNFVIALEIEDKIIADYILRYVTSDKTIKEETRTGVAGTEITLADEDKAEFTLTEGNHIITYTYASDDSAGMTINADGTTVVTITMTASEQNANYTLRYVFDGKTIKEETKTGIIGSEISLSDEDKATFSLTEGDTTTTYTYAGDNSAGMTIASDGSTVVTITMDATKKSVYSLYSWDFTNWSEETVANLKEGSNWSDIEKANATEPTEASKDNCFWQVNKANDLSADKYVMANGTVISELEGLVYTNEKTDRVLAIAVNYPEPDASKDFGPYHGPSYLWLGAGTEFFIIPNVPAGASIKMGVESHKISDARGVKLSVDGTELLGPNGEPVATPIQYTDQEWVISEDAAEFNDVKITATAGCHIYYIKVTHPENQMYTLRYVAGEETLKEVKKFGKVDSVITLTDDDKASFNNADNTVSYVFDRVESENKTVASDGSTVLTVYMVALEFAPISWSAESTTLKVRDELDLTFNNDENLHVSFESDNEKVATVDEEGNISLTGELGTANITATYDGEAEGAKYLTTTVSATIEVVTNVTEAYAWVEYPKVESIKLNKLYKADKYEKDKTLDAESLLINDDYINIKTVYSAKYTSYGKDYLGETFEGAIQLGRVNAAPTDDNKYGTKQEGNSPIIIAPKADCKVVMFLRRQAVEVSISEEDDEVNNVITQTHNIGMSTTDKGIDAVAHSDIETKLPQNLVFGVYGGDAQAKDNYMWCAVEWDMKAGETYTIFTRGTTISMNGIGYYIDVNGLSFDNAEETTTMGSEKAIPVKIATSTESITVPIKWESSNIEIASVDEDGNVTGHTVGKADITAKCLDFTASYTVKVYPRLGDADWNGEIRIADAVDISNYVVGKKEADSSWEKAEEWEEFYLAGANANGEGDITFADASAAAELALREPKSETEEPTEESTQTRIAAYADDADALVIRSSANGNFAVALDNTEAYVALQADIILPEGCNVDVKAAGRAAGSHSMLTRKHADNHIRVIFFNLSNTAFADSDAPMFEIMTDSNISAEDIVITNIYASDAKAKETLLAAKIGSTSGVAAIGLDENEPVKVYDLSGIYVGDSLEGLQQGTYIVRQGDAARKLRVR